MASNRIFLQASPSLNSMSWEAEWREPNEFYDKQYFYAKFTIAWGTTLIPIHSYIHHGGNAYEHYVIKVKEVIRQIDRFIRACQINTFATEHTLLNSLTGRTPFSGSIFWMRDHGVLLRGDPTVVFEIASCNDKLRLHAKHLGGEENMCEVLSTIKSELHYFLTEMEHVYKNGPS